LATLPPLWQFVSLLVVHWIGDFVLQSSWMANNKSERFDALIAHVLAYSVTLALGSSLIFGLSEAKKLLVFVGVNAVLHFATDFVTSRISAAFRQRERWHAFFVVVGGDQLLHHVCLALTLSIVFAQS